MDRALIQQGGTSCLLGEALPSVISSTQVFANAPTGTNLIYLTIRGGGVTIRTDGNAATAAGNGIDYGAGTYQVAVSKTDALKYRMIAAYGTVTGWIEYHKIP